MLTATLWPLASRATAIFLKPNMWLFGPGVMTVRIVEHAALLTNSNRSTTRKHR